MQGKGADGTYSYMVDCITDPKTGLPDKNCRWLAFRKEQEATASIMYDQTIDAVSDHVFVNCTIDNCIQI